MHQAPFSAANRSWAVKRQMRQSWPAIGLAVALGAILSTLGCATTGTPTTNTVVNLDGQASTLLSGANIQEARSVAMGAARSKGWTIQSVDGGGASNTRLVLEREVSPSAPQAAALGTLPGHAPPRVRVETTLVQQNNGTEVGLRAFMVVNPGTASEQQIEYTKDYEDDLAISLSALQSAWLAAGHRVASEAPVPDSAAPFIPDAVAPQESAPQLPEQSAAGIAEAPLEDRSPTAPPGDLPTPIQDEITVIPADGEMVPEPSPWRREPPQPLDWPVEQESPAPASPSNQMMVLSPSARIGIWAYYAERYAQEHGCAVADPGATLLQKTPAFELHEVGCADRSNILVKCQGGICEQAQ